MPKEFRQYLLDALETFAVVEGRAQYLIESLFRCFPRRLVWVPARLVEFGQNAIKPLFQELEVFCRFFDVFLDFLRL